MSTRNIPFILILAAIALTACDDDLTYAELREREKNQIEAFIKNGCCVTDDNNGDTLLYVAPINTITEAEYKAAGNICDLRRNDYVYLSDREMYMQVVRKGTGDMGRTQTDAQGNIVPVRGDTIATGTTRRIFVRYTEYNIAGDSIQTSNVLSPSFAQMPDIMSVTNNSGTLTGTFVSGVMNQYYSSTAVPNGWLYPLYYVCLGRYCYEDSEIAKVRIIVPSTEGQTDASTSTYPCFYEITYESDR